ncbi:hypothetical protein AB0D91_14175 [Streptomyces canus]|uniref:hypothetical protein n=1 Tax=Streptomyces canus TaxID=58343 RepID=UPI0033C3A752
MGEFNDGKALAEGVDSSSDGHPRTHRHHDRRRPCDLAEQVEALDRDEPRDGLGVAVAANDDSTNPRCVPG